MNTIALSGRRSDAFLTTLIAALVRPLRHLVIRLQAEAELSTMDDRMLSDINVQRDQIRNIARRHADAICG